MLSEDIESLSHTKARLILTDAMQQNGYEVKPGYYFEIKWACGIPARKSAGIPPDEGDDCYHEVDLRAIKTFEFDLKEELVIEIGGRDTRHQYDDDGEISPPPNSSKYVYKKQKGNDELFEKWLKIMKPDAILIRPNKEDIITLSNPVLVYNHIQYLKRRYINDFLTEKSSKNLL